MSFRHLLAASLLVGSVGAVGCNKLKDKAGGSIPSGVPSAPATDVDPNTCGNYSSSDAGGKLKAFLTATKDLRDKTDVAAKTVHDACITMGQELNMSADALGGDDTGKICDAVIKQYTDNLSVAVKGKAALKISVTPGKCTVQASASASAGASCSGAAAAGTSGGGGDAQCSAAAKVEASIHAECTPPQFSITADAKLVVDKAKLDMTIKALQDGIPKLLDIKAQIEPIKEAAAYWAATVKDVAGLGAKFTQTFQDQAMCISSQLALAAKASAHIEANVNVSVSVSASASGSVGG